MKRKARLLRQQHLCAAAREGEKAAERVTRTEEEQATATALHDKAAYDAECIVER